MLGSKALPKYVTTYGPFVTTNGLSSSFVGRKESILESDTMNVLLLLRGHNSETWKTLLISCAVGGVETFLKVVGHPYVDLESIGDSQRALSCMEMFSLLS